MREKIKSTIDEYKLLVNKDKVLVAVSGGPDSVCLLYVLIKLKKNLFPGLQLVIAYINHGVRIKEAINEIKFINRLGFELGIPVHVRKIKINRKGGGFESAARKQRYAALVALAEKFHCTKIATGHTMTDQAETVILNLLRSTCREGIIGMPYIRNVNDKLSIIRPLLKVTREEITGYLAHNRIKYCVVSSNLKPVYTRNKVRLDLIPVLKQYNPHIIEHLSNLYEWSSIKEAYFDRIISKTIKSSVHHRKNGITVDLKNNIRYNKYLLYKLFKTILEGKLGTKSYTKYINQFISKLPDKSEIKFKFQ